MKNKTLNMNDVNIENILPSIKQSSKLSFWKKLFSYFISSVNHSYYEKKPLIIKFPELNECKYMSFLLEKGIKICWL